LFGDIGLIGFEAQHLDWLLDGVVIIGIDGQGLFHRIRLVGIHRDAWLVGCHSMPPLSPGKPSSRE